MAQQGPPVLDPSFFAMKKDESVLKGGRWDDKGEISENLRAIT